MSEFNNIESAAEWIRRGKLLAYPTESVWGIGCDAMQEQAVNKIINIKNRPIEKGMIVITDSIDRIESFLANLTWEQRKPIIDSYYSKNRKQATTWLLPIPNDIYIPKWVTGDHNDLAIRVIAHPLIKILCSKVVSNSNPFGFIISTSCNPSGYEPARTIQEAQTYFYGYDNVAYLQADTLGYSLPSQIKNIDLKIVR